MTMASTAPTCCVGDRVAAGKEGHVGTARYVGSVEGQDEKQLWVGIEWDEPSRGKHDGTVDGVRYFSCSVGGTPASLVKIEKVNVGVALLDALKSRYGGAAAGGASDAGAKADEEGMFVNTVTDQLVSVELIGKDKLVQKQSLNLLTVASLRRCFVSRAGTKEELESLAPRLQELDLSGNLLSSWEEVGKIAAALPALTAINLTSNLLGPSAALQAPLDRISVLVLNCTGIQWTQMLDMEPLLPQLTELHLNSCGIKALEPTSQPSPSQFRRLSILSFEDNGISDWEGVAPLGSLAALVRLHLSRNPLKEVKPPGSLPDASDTWESLKAMTLGQNQLTEWSSINALGRFPSLGELRLTGNPLFDHARSGGRFEVVARMERLELLNGSAVKPRERQDAELRYLRTVWAELHEAGDNGNAACKASHPRLEALLERYGTPNTAAASLDDAQSSMESQMLQVSITCVTSKAGKNMGTKVKKLPRSMTLAQLKKLCEGLFKVTAQEQAVFLKAPDNPVPEALGSDDDDRQLDFFGIENGWEVIVSDVDSVKA